MFITISRDIAPVIIISAGTANWGFNYVNCRVIVRGRRFLATLRDLLRTPRVSTTTRVPSALEKRRESRINRFPSATVEPSVSFRGVPQINILTLWVPPRGDPPPVDFFFLFHLFTVGRARC